MNKMKLWFFSKDHKPGDVLSNLQKEVKSKIPKIPTIPKNINLKIPANMNIKSLTDFISQMIKNLQQGSIPSKPAGPAGPSRPMKFPYTFSAKIAQFPFRHYYKNNWIARWYPFGVLACAPLFWYISRMANSKENKAKWKEIRRLEREEAQHKFDYK